MSPQLKHFFEKWQKEVERALNRYLPSAKTQPQTIHKAMRYSIFAGGKRLRPMLVIAAAETCGLAGKKVLPTACAMELIHTYSLIHDDLPAMDDDDFRRGKPTNHKVFGEGIAILAGDALLTHAFELIAKNGIIKFCAPAIPKVLSAIATRAGSGGMVGGQVLDLEMEEGRWLKKGTRQQKEILKTIHLTKTAALIQASILAGALLAKTEERKRNQLSEYGKKIGLAFQITDDILDITADKKLLGKKGSDRINKKLTYPALFGIEESRKKAHRLIQKAKEHLQIFGKRGDILRDLADYIVERTY